MIDDLRFALRPTVELSETVEETTPEARSKPPPTEIGAAAPPPVREPPGAAPSPKKSPPAPALPAPPTAQSAGNENPAPQQSESPRLTCARTVYYGVQLGAFRVRGNANHLAERLREAQGDAQIHAKETEKGPLYFVIAGCFDAKAAAAALSDKLQAAGHEGILVRASAARFGPTL